MLCPNCRKTLKEDKKLSKGDKKVYKFFLVGIDAKTAKAYCPQCINTRTKEK